MKERLPPLQRAIKKEADELGLITTSTNCHIQVLKKNDEGQFLPIIVNSMKSVHDAQNVAEKRDKSKLKKHNGSSANFTPLHQYQTDHLNKRSRSLPGDT